MPAASFKYSNNALMREVKEGRRRALRFASVLSHSDNRRICGLTLTQIYLWQTSHTCRTLGVIVDFRRENKIGGKDERYKTGNA